MPHRKPGIRRPKCGWIVFCAVAHLLAGFQFFSLPFSIDYFIFNHIQPIISLYKQSLTSHQHNLVIKQQKISIMKVNDEDVLHTLISIKAHIVYTPPQTNKSRGIRSLTMWTPPTIKYQPLIRFFNHIHIPIHIPSQTKQ